MRTNIEINNHLMSEAKRLSNLKTKKQIIEEALRNYVNNLKIKELLNLRGENIWVGNLDELRSL